jgi:hypothetical protein
LGGIVNMHVLILALQRHFFFWNRNLFSSDKLDCFKCSNNLLNLFLSRSMWLLYIPLSSISQVYEFWWGSIWWLEPCIHPVKNKILLLSLAIKKNYL